VTREWLDQKAKEREQKAEAQRNKRRNKYI
jgi:hypothetical protein